MKQLLFSFCAGVNSYGSGTGGHTCLASVLGLTAVVATLTGHLLPPEHFAGFPW